MNRNIMITAIVALAVGLGAGLLIDTKREPGGEASIPSAQTEKKPLFYRNPMNPVVTSPVPAQDEMGMDYIPVYADVGSGDAPAGTVSIDPGVAQNIGVRTAVAERRTISRDIRTIGRVTFDEQRVARLHPKVEGWVEKLFVDKTGDMVKKDTMLLSIYSPQLVASEEEYILALNNAETLASSPFAEIRDGAESLKRSARERLELFDVPAHQLRELERTHKVIKNLHIHSPFDGVVMKIGAREGSRITPETELYMIADLSRVWVVVDLYEDDMPWVSAGDSAEITVAGIPGRSFRGKVTYIYPYLEGKTRTNKVRIEFDNPGLLLKPDMFANITLKTSKTVNAVVVPAEAVVRSGERDQLFVERAPGRFEPRAVKLGLSAAGLVQIVDGLAAGERVVTSSQFLIDSESKLKEATAKMLEGGSLPDNQQGADDMEMDGMSMEGMKMDSMPAEPAPEMQKPMPMEHHHDHH